MDDQPKRRRRLSGVALLAASDPELHRAMCRIGGKIAWAMLSPDEQRRRRANGGRKTISLVNQSKRGG